MSAERHDQLLALRESVGFESSKGFDAFIEAAGISPNWRRWDENTWQRVFRMTQNCGPGWVAFWKTIAEARRDPEHPNNRRKENAA